MKTAGALMLAGLGFLSAAAFAVSVSAGLAAVGASLVMVGASVARSQ